MIFTATDEIRARGLGTSLEVCENCRLARKMDDLHRHSIENLKVEAGKLVSDAGIMARSRSHWRLGCFVAVVVAVLFAMSDFGVFKP